MPKNKGLKLPRKYSEDQFALLRITIELPPGGRERVHGTVAVELHFGNAQERPSQMSTSLDTVISDGRV